MSSFCRSMRVTVWPALSAPRVKASQSMAVLPLSRGLPLRMRIFWPMWSSVPEVAGECAAGAPLRRGSRAARGEAGPVGTVRRRLNYLLNTK